MKVVALISGGKDSCFNMMHVVSEGHEVVALANLHPNNSDKDELDSYMYQTVGHEAIDLYSEAMEIPLFRRQISGTSKTLNMDYVPDVEDEVEDLYELLREIQVSVHFDAVASGAILSDYQRIRVESVCSRLGLMSLSYLWRRNQEELLQEMIDSGLKAMLIKTAALGLDPKKHLGKTLAEMSETLHQLSKKYSCHVCGEGGEFETFTLDCPLFKKRIVIDDTEVIIHSDDYYAPVGYLKLKRMHLEQKSENDVQPVHTWPIITSEKWEGRYISKLKSHKSDVKIDKEKIPQIFNEETIRETDQNKQEHGVHLHERFLTISNLVGSTSKEINSEVVEKVTLQLLEKLIGILTKNGLNSDNVCYVQINVSDMSHYKYINKVYTKFFERNPPARACIGCISNPQNIVQKTILQIYCISCKDHSSKKSMHVQGISHWAPANIGPFSQCILVNGILFVSGTIALIPGSMKLISGGAEAQASLALHHVENVMLAMCNAPLKNLIQCICYVTNVEDLSRGICAWNTANQGHSEGICKVLYLVVNELPKAASTEWQAIAMNNNQETDVLCESGQFKSKHGFDVDWNFMKIVQENRTVYTFSSSIGVNLKGYQVDSKSCINCLQASLLSWLKDEGLDVELIVKISIFYVVEGDLQSAIIQESWMKSGITSKLPNITPVQVKNIFIDDKFRHMTLSCSALT